jgi:hypothetical protein
VHFNELRTETCAFLMPIAPSSPILPPSWVPIHLNRGPALSGRKDEPKQALLNESQSERQAGVSALAYFKIQREQARARARARASASEKESARASERASEREIE